MKRFFATLTVAAMLFGTLGTPAFAGTTQFGDVESSHVSDSFDLLVMRPVGLVALAVGAVLWVPAAAMTAAVQPSEIKKPTEALVMKPYRYVFVDSIGSH